MPATQSHLRSASVRKPRTSLQGLDVENFIKPILDAIAAGLLYDEETDLSTVKKWNYNDSNFNTLLIHRLADATKRQDEGIAISVSSSASHPFTGSG